MTKKTILWCILSILTAIYIVVALCFTEYKAHDEMCRSVDITVVDPANIQFVTVEDIIQEIGNDKNQFLSKKLNDINTYELEEKLNAIDKIEKATCAIFNNFQLKINVIPLIPVARIFDNGKSYYINQDGKEMEANARYHIDVPIIVGKITSKESAISLLPLLSFINNDSTWNSVISSIKIAPNNDIILVPSIKGHVINLGDTSLLENKFSRLRTMYQKVLPIKGWNYYDTISLKWDGQAVASRSIKPVKQFIPSYNDSIDEEEVEVETMNVSSIAISSNSNENANETVNSETKETNQKTATQNKLTKSKI
ncbi:MAG: hypothetical protein E7081_00730 [Bacteroidales bacterium]|nr:hypothetical protein [Bacteroidales bacterium]